MKLLSPSFARPSCSLTVSSSPSGRELVIAVAGEADWSTADLLERQLVEAFTPEVLWLVLDLERLTFCNLRGLGALHEAVAVARTSGIDVTVRGMSRQLGWLHATFPERLSPIEGPAGERGAPLRRDVPVDASALARTWESADSA